MNSSIWLAVEGPFAAPDKQHYVTFPLPLPKQRNPAGLTLPWAAGLQVLLWHPSLKATKVCEASWPGPFPGIFRSWSFQPQVDFC